MGFLSSMLPALEGAAVMAGGAAMGVPVDPSTAAMIVGGVNGAASGSLRKGITSGMGAYGGAGLTQGLMGAGAGAIGQQAADEALAQSWQNPDAVGVTRLTDQQVQDQIANKMANATPWDQIKAGFGSGNVGATMEGIGGPSLGRAGFAIGAPILADKMTPTVTQAPAITKDADMGQRYAYSANKTNPMPAPDVPGYGQQGQNFGREQRYFQPQYTPISNDQAKALYGYANGGIMDTGALPASNFDVAEANGGLMSGYAGGGGISEAASHLGGYSDGGRLLRGPGDGVSDSIPAVIGHKQPARLADGEFVVPARIVSEIGNGSTEAGARKLYAMMDRVQKARKKTTGKDKVATNTKADKFLPA